MRHDIIDTEVRTNTFQSNQHNMTYRIIPPERETMKLNFEDAIRYIHENPEIYLSPDRSGKGFTCPVCGSGQGKNGTGITSKDGGKHFTCWKGCYTSADIIDIIGITESLEDKQKYSRAFEIYGIEIDKTAEPLPATKPEKKTEPEQPEQDFSDYFRKCAKDLQESWTEDCYLARRGISKETARKYLIGIDHHFKTKDRETDKFTEWKGIVIPTGSGTYVIRNTDQACSTGNRHRNRGKATPFNLEVLKSASNPVFITEGEIDALSVIEAGGTAVGLGGINAGVRRAFLEAVKESKRKHKYVIALDHETEPEKIENIRQTAEELQRDLNELGAEAYVLDPYEEYKDANEALQKCRQVFAENIRGIIYSLSEKSQEQPEKKDGILWEYMKNNSTQRSVLDFLGEIDKSANFPVIPTGFSNLDMILDGGLHAELYTLTAGTGTGKTNLILQIADQIAQQGHYVHFYNLEMATRELIARSVSRHTALNALAGKAEMGNAKSAMDIMTGSKWKEYTNTEKELIAKSVNDYGEYCDNIRFFEYVGYVDTQDVRRNVEYHIATKGRPPVVIIDYLQMLSIGVALRNKGMTERQCIDTAMLDLKQISRDYQTAVIIISAINRESSKRNEEIELESAKESGTIEYTSGVQLSLDFESRGTSGFEMDAEMTATPRRMKIKNLKSRHAQGRNYVLMDFYPRYSLFRMRAERNR